jgi:yecA family protein
MEFSQLYDELDRQLTNLHAEMQASESHGVLCARFCLEQRPDPALWVQEVIGQQDVNNLQVQASQVSLAHLYQQTEQAFQQALEEFSLFMPDDNEILSARLQALVDWCSGFIGGMGLSGMQIDDKLDPAVKEILMDMMELTHMDVDVDADNENEAAFVEIEEYIRVGVMTIGLTLREAQQQPTLH